jgi:hypothetical protein
VAPTERAGAGAGKVMYFQKPADSLTANLPPAAADNAPARLPVSDAGRPAALPPVTAPAAPPVIPDRPLPAPRGTLSVQDAQPKKSTSDKKQPGPLAPPPGYVTELPSRDKIFLMLDDRTLERAVIDSLERQLQKDLTGFRFPDLTPVVPPGTTYQPKTLAYGPGRVMYEPNYVAHRRLHFEEKNAERAGWDLGIIQPFVSTAYFYKDVALWPNSLASGVRTGFWDTSAGKCLPGSPTPYYLYPPGLTITGSVFEAAVITGIAIVIP